MSEETRKDRLRSMIDAIVDDNQEQAEVDFHGVATDIVKNLIGIPTEPEYAEVETDADETEEQTED